MSFSRDFYSIDWLRALNIEVIHHLQTVKNNGKTIEREGFELSTVDGTEVYLDGFKQMISHYIGIRGFKIF